MADPEEAPEPQVLKAARAARFRQSWEKEGLKVKGVSVVGLWENRLETRSLGKPGG